MSARFGLGILLVSILSLMASLGQAAPPPTHTDEARVPAYTLPDPLRFPDGTAVATAADWVDRRRPQLLAEFTEQMFGKAPPAPKKIKFQVVSESDQALHGTAIRKEIEIVLADEPQPVTMTMLLYVPKSERPVAAFWGLNFQGNQTVTTEPEVRINPNWMDNKTPNVVDHRATEASRGQQANRWPLEMIVGRGYAVATAYYGDIDPDFDDGFQNGIHAALRKPGQKQPAADEWGSIAAWAWGMSRGLDYLEQDPLIDGQRVAVIGHSRLGKTALWAGATDPRFALVISNNSGCGGAALSRRIFGETVGAINHNFPHWFCANFKQYSENEAALPIDQHELLALIAPRPVYVASASEDLWADPKGEFLATVHADPVYRLLGTDGLGGSAPPAAMPAAEQPLKTGAIGYHLRSGKHDITAYDWQQYLDFADRHLKPARADENLPPKPKR
jgi:hypothetical protein